VSVTHPERVIDPASGLTKLDLVRYYDSVVDFMLPHLVGRPVALLRGPGGVAKPQFFQKHLGAGTMAGVQVLDAALWPGHEALLEVRTRQALLGAAQMNVIEFHTWNADKRRLDRPDRMIFDLDPGEGVAWPMVREAALLNRALLQELGLQSWLKTSGGKGLHLVVPLAPRWGWGTVKGFSQAIVQHLARTLPQRFVAKSGPDNRKGRIFADYLRNGEGATTVAAFSARARPGLGVSMPLSWAELDAVKASDQWTVANAMERLTQQASDPWADMAELRQSLTGPMKALGYKAPAPAD
jgi:bifunctional non-homologous end joining protein LigD